MLHQCLEVLYRDGVARKKVLRGNGRSVGGGGSLVVEECGGGKLLRGRSLSIARFDK